jgi:hypothetical protein
MHDYLVNVEDIQFSVLEVRSAISKMRPGGAAGPDGIPAIVYRVSFAS